VQHDIPRDTTFWAPLQQAVAQPVWIILAAIAELTYKLTKAHLKRRDNIPLETFLQVGGMDIFYRTRLTALLGWFQHHLCPPEYLDPDDPTFCPQVAKARA